jgi:hypothetical protein
MLHKACTLLLGYIGACFRGKGWSIESRIFCSILPERSESVKSSSASTPRGTGAKSSFMQLLLGGKHL